MDTRGGGNLTDMHIANFLQAVRGEAELTAPIDEGHRSVLLCQLGNIAQVAGRTLHLDQKNGHIQNDAEAMAMWSREYEPGWEPTL